VAGPLVAVLDYGIGNLRSAQKALVRVGADARLTADTAEIEAADGVVLPGVGAFAACIGALRESGLDKLAVDAVAADVPFMGICVGMQLLYDGSDENPDAVGLGIVSGRIQALPDTVKRPQMQWNVLDRVRESAMLQRLEDPVWVYFVHSYAAELSGDVVATCDYGGPATAAIERGRLWATQFHPEKSGAAGMAILAAFVDSLR
jgi:imidazole glycerol-phosphate synthase subunit HisH